jgi:uncharacterized protein
MNWQQNLIDNPSGIRELIRQTKRIAVLGIKTEAQADQPAFYVPKYLSAAGFEIIPVPVYYPEVTAMPTAVWFQSGIRNDTAAETLAKTGIRVVQDRCLMVEHRSVAKG